MNGIWKIMMKLSTLLLIGKILPNMTGTAFRIIAVNAPYLSQKKIELVYSLLNLAYCDTLADTVFLCAHTLLNTNSIQSNHNLLFNFFSVS